MTAAYSADETVNRGKAIYEQKLKSLLNSGNIGKWVIIDIEIEDYEIGDDSLIVSSRLHQRHPGVALYAMKIGQQAPVRLGASLALGKL